MTKIRHFVLLLAALALTTAVRAQNLLGDLNHNGNIDVNDITLLIDDYLSGGSEEIPYTIDNSLIAGRWYQSADEYLTFYEDGTSDIFEGARYLFYVVDDYGILLVSLSGIPMYIFQVPEFSDNRLVIMNAATGDGFELAKAIIELSEQELTLTEGDQVQLTANVVPEDAGKVYWKSNTPGVARVSSDGLVTAVSEGTATITAEVAGIQATCNVMVIKKSFNNGHEFVDMGLSVKWATMNVGANAPEDYGDYFAWGETTPKSRYAWDTYKWCNGDYKQLTKYNDRDNRGTVDNKSTLDLSDDAAYANWGSTWRMPTYTDWEELVNQCTWKRTTQNGVSGYKVIASNGSSIFLPAANLINYSTPDPRGLGFYWSNSLDSTTSYNGAIVLFSSTDASLDSFYRYVGIPVRPVCP